MVAPSFPSPSKGPLMAWIDHHSRVVGMAVFALAYLDSLVTFPVSNARTTGPPRTTPPLHREPESP